MKRYIFLLCLIFGFVKTEYERNNTSGIMVAIFGKEFFNKNNMTIQENKSLQYDQEEKHPYYNNEEFEDCDCGPVYNNQERIYKGKDVNPLHKYPWAVYITFMKNSYIGGSCTGSIIHENFVLSAAHCFMMGKTIKEGIIKIDTVKVYVGKFSTSSLDDIENVTQIVQINKIIIHEEVNLNFRENDIALLRLSKPLDLKSHKEIKSICLPKSSITDAENMTTIGWGGKGPDEEIPIMLQEAQFEVRKKCPNPFPFPLNSRLLCIIGDSQVSPLCKGDSGGPTMRIKNGRYEVVGIASFSKTFVGKCFSSTKLNFLVNVAEYNDWIKRYVQFNCL
ncbi:UNVERIFIED_CONTAM: hypothetical protein RMT77_005227 [Armadillidium vulgare]